MYRSGRICVTSARDIYVTGLKQLSRPSNTSDIINVSTASSKWWPSASLLQPCSFIVVFSAPRRIFEQSEHGFSSCRASNTISRISVGTRVYGTPSSSHIFSTPEKSMPGKPVSMVMPSSSNGAG